MRSRRKLISGCAATALFAGLCAGDAQAFMLTSYRYLGLSGYPGQSRNPVGYAATPILYPSSTGTTLFPNLWPAGAAWPGQYPGSLTVNAGTSFTSGTSGSPNVYSFLDVITSNGQCDLSSLSWVVFVGCRFQSSAGAGVSNVYSNGGANLFFFYCSVVPKATDYVSPPGGAWPSSTVGSNSITFISGTNCTDGTRAYQYGMNFLSGGPTTTQYCDFWGFGNGGPLYYSTTAQMTCDNCWIHDATNPAPASYHTDATGYLNGGTPPQNVTVNHCTMASLGNTNAVAFQASTGTPYSNIIVTNNYISGFGYTACLFLPSGTATNNTFTGNVFATDIAWIYGPIYPDPTSLFNYGTYGNLWRQNTLSVYPGTTPQSGSTLTYTAGDNGKYLLPNTTLSTTDYTG